MDHHKWDREKGRVYTAGDDSFINRTLDPNHRSQPNSWRIVEGFQCKFQIGNLPKSTLLPETLDMNLTLWMIV